MSESRLAQIGICPECYEALLECTCMNKEQLIKDFAGHLISEDLVVSGDREVLERELKQFLDKANGELEKELADLHHLFACVVDHATGGRISKTNYTKEVYYEQIDDRVQREIDEAIKENQELAPGED